jgi:hypothetical protein
MKAKDEIEMAKEMDASDAAVAAVEEAIDVAIHACYKAAAQEADITQAFQWAQIGNDIVEDWQWVQNVKANSEQRKGRPS